VLQHSQPLFTELKARVIPQIGKLKLKDMDKAQLQKLECIAGISALALSRLIHTDRLVQELKTALQTKSGYKSNIDKRNTSKQAFTNQMPLEVEAALFALLKNDFQISLIKILSLSAKQLEVKLQQAIKQNEIGLLPNQAVINNLLVSARDILLLNANADEDNYDAKLIHISSVSNTVKTDLLNKVMDAGGLRNWFSETKTVTEKDTKQNKAVSKKINLKAAATSFKNDISSLLVKELQAIVELDEQLKKFPPLLAVTVNEIRNKNGVIDLQKLAGKTEIEWLALIIKTTATKQFPNTYPDNKESIKIYAKDIATGFATKFPALTILSKIGDSKMEKKTLFKSILTKNPDFDITKQSVNTWFKVAAKPVAVNEISAKNLQQLQQLQRCIKLTDGLQNMQHTEALMQSGIASSHQITRMGKYAFAQTMMKQKLNEAASTAIYNKAQHITNTVKMLAVNYIRYERKGSLMPRFLQFDQLNADDTLGLPDMETLFGSLNSCSCSHCQSVYSAAAYLTDLLHWLKSDIVCTTSGINGFAALSGTATLPRRKDIAHILLNCKNTNELLPYIDLVNEILSINLLKSPDYSVLQTTKTSKELIAEPEHRFTEAEDKLTTALFPFILPYDVGFDKSYTYLNALNIQPHQFIYAFNNYDNKFDIKFAQAYLNICTTEKDLITVNHSLESNFWKDYFGLSTKPTKVGELLKSIGLTISQLKEYLSISYIVADDKPISIVPNNPDDCNLDEYTLSSDFSLQVADRFMRFMRLHRKTNLSYEELDLAILVLGGDINEILISNLTSILDFCEQKPIKLTELLLWFSSAPYLSLMHSNSSEYYINKFQNENYDLGIKYFFDPAIPNASSFFKQITTLTPLELNILSNVFKVSFNDIESLIQYLNFSASDTLHYDNIAKIERYCSFCKVFEIPFSELNSIFKLIPDPFKPTGTTMTKIGEFAKNLKIIKSINVSPSIILSVMEGSGYYDLSTNCLQFAEF
jgi:Salmonella virulence plasmid 28.1kDa A protein